MHDVIVRADQGRCWERPEHEVRWSGGTEDRGGSDGVGKEGTSRGVWEGVTEIF